MNEKQEIEIVLSEELFGRVQDLILELLKSIHRLGGGRDSVPEGAQQTMLDLKRVVEKGYQQKALAYLRKQLEENNLEYIRKKAEEKS